MGQEIWKPVAGYEGVYEVSDQGRVKRLTRVVTDRRNIKRLLKERIFKPQVGGFSDYLQVVFLHNGRSQCMRIHRMVARAFLPDWDEALDVNHKNGKRYDNRLVNLEMCTRVENVLHAFNTGLNTSHGVRHYKSTLILDEVWQIKLLYYFWNFRQKDLAVMYGLPQSSIWKIVHNKTYQR